MTLEHEYFSAVAHANHIFCSPLNSDQLDWLINAIHLPASARLFDAGCGKAEVLIRFIKRYAVQAVGVDHSSQFLREAYRQAIERVPMHKLTLHYMDIQAYAAAPKSFEMGICIGSSHLYGGYRNTLRAMARVARQYVLVGELFWQREPDPEFLADLGITADAYTDYTGLITAGSDEGLTPLYSFVSSQQDWDHYEWLYNWSLERYVADHPHDPNCDELRTRAVHGRERYLRWGRDTFGFGLVLFGVNDQPG